jgi:hypothetical protein
VTRTGWLDLGAGVAGDMLLGALVGAGVPLDTVRSALAPLDLPIALRAEDVRRGGLAAVRVVVDVPEEGQPHRTWADVRLLLDRLPEPLRSTSTAVFAALARAEAAVHGVAEDEVHFHEVGALDAVADVVGVCAGLAALGLDEFVASPVTVGSGSVRTAHGALPVPVPAVVALLAAAGAPARGGSFPGEQATPTGVALVTVLADRFGPMPAMRPSGWGAGAGTRDPADRANVVRLVVGEGQAADPPGALLLESTVDDLDPRVWPLVLAALLAAGAHDAWLTPVLMKKGRPGHVVAALTPPAAAAPVRGVLFRETTTLGVRETVVARTVLDREFRQVDVDGQTVAVKLGLLDGAVVNAMPEFEDVVRAAQGLGLPVEQVLARARGLAQDLLGG